MKRLMKFLACAMLVTGCQNNEDTQEAFDPGQFDNTAPLKELKTNLDTLHTQLDQLYYVGGKAINVTSLKQSKDVMHIRAVGAKKDLMTLYFNKDSVEKYKELGQNIVHVTVVETKGNLKNGPPYYQGELRFFENAPDIIEIGGGNCPPHFINFSWPNRVDVQVKSDPAMKKNLRKVVKKKDAYIKVGMDDTPAFTL